MWRQLTYGFCMAVALLGLYVKGSDYLSTLRFGRWTTVPPLLDLAYLLTILALVIIIGRKLFHSLLGRATHNREEEF